MTTLTTLGGTIVETTFFTFFFFFFFTALLVVSVILTRSGLTESRPALDTLLMEGGRGALEGSWGARGARALEECFLGLCEKIAEGLVVESSDEGEFDEVRSCELE